MTGEPDALPWSQGHWRDEAGVLWRRRNGEISVSRLRRLMRDEQVAVIRRSGDELTVVAPTARLDLLTRMTPYLKGTADRSDGDHTDFQVTEFTTPDHRRLLVIDESC